MSAYTADAICIYLSAIIPIVLIFVFRWRGFIYGVLTVWIMGIIAGYLLSGFDPDRGGSVRDTVWLLGGWIGGILYCLPLLGIRELLFWVYKHPILKQHSTDNDIPK
jgi:hypothetical protein